MAESNRLGSAQQMPGRPAPGGDVGLEGLELVGEDLEPFPRGHLLQSNGCLEDHEGGDGPAPSIEHCAGSCRHH